MKLPLWLIASTAFALGGCDFAPRYAPPQMFLPAKFKDASANGAALPANQAWWRSFDDRTLDDLEAQVDAANPTLAAAIAANDAAAQRAVQAAAGLLPQINGIGQITANKQSNNRPLRGADEPNYYGNNILGAQVSYEIDIWGRVRDLVKAASLTAEASVDALADARLELHAELARAYIDLRGLDAQAKLISSTIGIYSSALDLTKSQTPGADRIASRRRPRADAAEFGRGAGVGDRAPAGGARKRHCGAGWEAGGVLLHREDFGRSSAAEAAARRPGRGVASEAGRRRAGASDRRRRSEHRRCAGGFLSPLHPDRPGWNTRHGFSVV